MITRRFDNYLALVTLIIAAGACAGQRSQHTERSGTVRIHVGQHAIFEMTDCVEVEASDTASTVDVRRLIVDDLLLCSRGQCDTAKDVKMRIFYQAGPGVCIDCGDVGESRSAFALIVVERRGVEVARAEWQYAAGGTAENVAHAFIRDMKLLTKPTQPCEVH